MPNWDKRQVAPGVKLQWGPLSAPHLFGALQMQSAVMGESENFSAGWMKRQQDFAGLALSTAVEVSTAGMTDPGRTLNLVTDFQKASAQYLTDEMRGYTEMVAHFMKSMGTGSSAPQLTDTETSAKPAAKKSADAA